MLKIFQGDILLKLTFWIIPAVGQFMPCRTPRVKRAEAVQHAQLGWYREYALVPKILLG